MHRISHFEVALRTEERLRQADLSRRNSLADRRPGWTARLIAAFGLRPTVAPAA